MYIIRPSLPLLCWNIGWWRVEITSPRQRKVMCAHFTDTSGTFSVIVLIVELLPWLTYASVGTCAALFMCVICVYCKRARRERRHRRSRDDGLRLNHSEKNLLTLRSGPGPETEPRLELLAKCGVGRSKLGGSWHIYPEIKGQWLIAFLKMANGEITFLFLIWHSTYRHSNKSVCGLPIPERVAYYVGYRAWQKWNSLSTALDSTF